MMIEDDGDIIRGLGFVTMYAAHLEGQIDELLFLLSELFEYSENLQRRPISAKIRLAQEVLSNMEESLAKEIIEDLNKCSEHFEWRNELIHGRIYAPDYHEKNLKSSRPNVPDRKADSEELYLLANNLDALRSRIYRPMIIQLPRLLNETGQRDA